MDRKDALYTFLVLVSGSWIALLIALIPNREWASQYGQQVVLASTLVGITAVVIGFLFYRFWPDNGRAGPRFEVKLSEMPRTPAELVFHLRDGQIKQMACFFEVSVRNVGVRTAENVVPIVLIPNRLALGVGLFYLSGPPTQRMAINGPWAVRDFKTDNIASAIIDNVAIKQIDLYGGGIGQRFALFFTLSGSDKIYLPCQGKTSLKLPERFYLTLSFQAKDMPLHHSKVYEVDARAWNDVSITELSSDLHQLLK